MLALSSTRWYAHRVHDLILAGGVTGKLPSFHSTPPASNVVNVVGSRFVSADMGQLDGRA